FLIQVILFLSLYYSLVHSRVDEEVNALLARGNSHRDVLEKNFEPQTIEHVALMESESQTKVVILSSTGNILARSNPIDMEMQKRIISNTKGKKISEKGMILEDHWKTANYICTVSPITVQGNLEGYVYTFQNTSSIRDMIERLTFRFIWTGLAT